MLNAWSTCVMFACSDCKKQGANRCLGGWLTACSYPDSRDHEQKHRPHGQGEPTPWYGDRVRCIARPYVPHYASCVPRPHTTHKSRLSVFLSHNRVLLPCFIATSCLRYLPVAPAVGDRTSDPHSGFMARPFIPVTMVSSYRPKPVLG